MIAVEMQGYAETFSFAMAFTPLFDDATRHALY